MSSFFVSQINFHMGTYSLFTPDAGTLDEWFSSSEKGYHVAVPSCEINMLFRQAKSS